MVFAVIGLAGAVAKLYFGYCTEMEAPRGERTVGQVMLEQPASAVDGPAPESVIARDMLKRAAMVGPVLVLVFGLIWGLDGAALHRSTAWPSCCANFVLAAAMLSYAARISPALLMFAALFGYLDPTDARSSLAVWFVVDASWVDLVPLGITIVVTHLGLLLWETSYVSASLAFPALKPSSAPVSKESSSK